MKKLLYWVALAATVTFVVMNGSVRAWAERRVALVVGNATYNAAYMSLPNPRNDAEDISKVLKEELDFKVVTALNATKRDMEAKLQEFARLAIDADAALFFYAGHAMQYQGRNFLMPTDAELEDEFSVQFNTVSMDAVSAAFERVSGVKIMILDACRNNPLANSLQAKIAGASRSVATTRGLARVDKTQGMVVAYATAPDDVANDGQGRNSPFTAALLKRLREPGVEIGIMLRRVAADVNDQTRGRQRPETTISLLSEYYLNQNDRIAWERLNQDDVAALRDFVRRFASSPLAIQASNRADQLERYAREREEQKRIAAQEEQKRREDQARIAAQEEQKRREEQTRIAAQEEQKRREEQARVAALEEQKRQEEQKRIATLEEQKRQEGQRRIVILEEQKRQDEQKRVAALEEQKRQDEQKRVAALEEQKRQDEQKRVAALEEQKRQDEQKREEEQKRIAALPADAPVTKLPPASTTPPGPAIQPQATKANLLEQVRQAQTELKRLGCFDGKPDGKMNTTTENAVKEFAKRSHKPVVEINITDDFIAELQRQRDDFCTPSKQPTVASHPSTHKPKPTATNTAEAPRPQQPAQQSPGARSNMSGVGF